MELQIIALAIVVGYLVGSVSFARMVARIASHSPDLAPQHLEVPGHEETFEVVKISATSISMRLGPRWGFITMMLDMLKVAVPTLVVRTSFDTEPYFLLTASAAMVGHIWPLYHGFRGGAGLTAIYGALWAIDWISIFATFIGGMFLGIVVLRNMMVAYFASLLLLIPWFWLRTGDWRYVVYAVVANTLFLLGMIPELKQYIRFRREGLDDSRYEIMRRTAMGRGIMKIARLAGIRIEEQ